MGWPQWIVVGLTFMGLGIALAKHGQPREDRYNFWARLAAEALVFGLLYAGGFFTLAQAQDIPAAAQQHKRTLIRAAHSQWGLDAPVAVFAAQVHQESAWRTDALSHVGAQGLAQFMPATARWWCGATGTAAADCQPTNPTWAMRSLVGYDKWLYDRAPAHYTPRDRMWVALRSYNGGLGHWQREAASTGLAQPSRTQVDAACGKARRAAVHCRENLGYPHRILVVLQPRYAAWGPGV
jgi:soluble lytic murein transglycosylase-like protein